VKKENLLRLYATMFNCLTQEMLTHAATHRNIQIKASLHDVYNMIHTKMQLVHHCRYVFIQCKLIPNWTLICSESCHSLNMNVISWYCHYLSHVSDCCKDLNSLYVGTSYCRTYEISPCSIVILNVEQRLIS